LRSDQAAYGWAGENATNCATPAKIEASVAVVIERCVAEVLLEERFVRGCAMRARTRSGLARRAKVIAADIAEPAGAIRKNSEAPRSMKPPTL
jgi:hypothetical protein